MSTVNLISTSLTPGMYIDLKIPAVTETQYHPNGLFPEFREVTMTGEKKLPIRGFVVENAAVGEITPVTYDETSVRYTHNKPYPNRVYFFALNDANTYIVNIVAVPIHDHSSISQGGPAYGTYFTDYTPAPTAENP
jgi:hypothetical protein